MKPGKESSSSALGNCENSKLVRAQKRDARNFVQQPNREWGNVLYSRTLLIILYIIVSIY